MIISALFSLHVLKSNFFQTKEKQKDFRRRAAEPLFFLDEHLSSLHPSSCLVLSSAIKYTELSPSIDPLTQNPPQVRK